LSICSVVFLFHIKFQNKNIIADKLFASGGWLLNCCFTPWADELKYRQLLNRIGSNGGNAISCDERGREPWNNVQIEQGISYKFRFSWDIRTIPSNWLLEACNINRREIVVWWCVRFDVWINSETFIHV
jgi:hypothetical protein